MIIPTRSKLLGEILSEETISEGGIILARTVKEIPRRAKVLAIGKPEIDKKGKELPQVAEVGDIVHFKRNFGTQWQEEIEGGKFRKYIFLKRDEVTAREVL